MKMRALLSCAAAVSLTCQVFAEVEKPKIKPTWSGARAGTWTMDFASALAKAGAEGKYTLLYFAGMWWCPRCQEFERWVLTNSKWKRFVKARGLYLTVLDFPARDGRSNWCWLWEPSYLKSTKMSAEDAARRIVDQYLIQEAFHDPTATRVRQAENFVVTAKGKFPAARDGAVFTPFAEAPTTSYHSVNYPGVLVFAPDGTEAGRFIPDKAENPDYTEENALEYCMAAVDAAINPDALLPWIGNWTLAFAGSDGAGCGTLCLTVDKKGKVKVSGMTPDGKKISATSTFVTGVERCLIPVRFNKRDAEPAFTIDIDITGEQPKTRLVGTDAYTLVAGGKAGVELPEKVAFTIGDGLYACEMESASGGKKLVSTSDSKVKLTYVPKTGAVKGSFKIGREKVSVTGVYCMQGGYGTAMINGTAYEVLLEASKSDDCDVCGL